MLFASRRVGKRSLQAADLEDARRHHLHLRERRRQPRRQHADDVPGLSVQCDHRADDCGAAAETRLPQLVAEDADGRSVRQILVRREITSERRHDAERWQERGIHPLAVQLFGIAVAGQREVVERRNTERLERRRVCAARLRISATTSPAR